MDEEGETPNLQPDLKGYTFSPNLTIAQCKEYSVRMCFVYKDGSFQLSLINTKVQKSSPALFNAHCSYNVRAINRSNWCVAQPPPSTWLPFSSHSLCGARTGAHGPSGSLLLRFLQLSSSYSVTRGGQRPY